MTTPGLLVPVDVAALCVGEPDELGREYGTKDFARVAADFSGLPYADAAGTVHRRGPNLGDVATPRPFERAAAPLPAGVHLHWALPDALAHGFTDGSGRVEFPAAPNRWLVVRVAGSASDPAAAPVLRAWVIESDRLWDDDGRGSDDLARAVPVRSNPMQASGTKAFRRLGRAFPLEDWPGETTSEHGRAPLTAVGYGTPAYAAAYPHCPSVFGFHDPADDLGAGAATVAYAVSGWYSDPAADPLTGRPAGELGWAAPEPAAPPARTVCAGVLHGIAWERGRKFIHEPPPLDVDVAVGSTTAEAVAALLARRNPTLPHVEPLLTLFQLGLLSRLGDAGGAAAVDAAVHAAGFGARAAGTVWVV
ncbi:MAG TPA: hypothetical protein VGW10_15560, partial [Solirubrobacteraceae bacterium]|nr:hypothetical protein [Solirubrobacteraceae bacterium]